MIRFASLYAALDATNSTTAKVEAMVRYLVDASPGDAAWAVYFLTGRRLKRLIPGRAIGDWAMATTGVSDWLLGECYSVVGDGAETAALLLDAVPTVPATARSLQEWVERRILPLRETPPEHQQAQVGAWVRELTRWERFTLFKLLTGEFRTGVSQTLVVRAVAQAAALPVTVIAARLTGDWTPGAEWYAELVAADVTDADRSRPYPFCLASPLEPAATGAALSTTLGEPDDWLIEWKWDGIRAQLVRRDGRVFLWSRGEDEIAERFPEVTHTAEGLPDGTVLDGEILAFRDGRPQPFAALQRRIGRLRQVARSRRDIPVVFMAYDVLEHDGRDVRDQPLGSRRERLETIVSQAQRAAPATPIAARDALLPFEDDDDGDTTRADATLQASPLIAAASWEAVEALRATARERGVEGVMIKRRTSPYGTGRKRGDWWKWKIGPHTVDAVLIYAQPGSGKRASLLTDYTFGLWSGGELVPVAKAYSGLSNEEIAEMDRWIRRHTVQRFGPVRHVEPVHVFELGFEAIAPSSRHRSGVAVRFPRMLRWRRDKTAAEADTLDTLVALIPKA